MPNWRPSKFFCRTCQAWYGPVVHAGCPFGGMLFVDLDSFQIACNQCNLTWPLTESLNRCSYNHIQQTEYVQSALTLEVGDKVIATDGGVVYVLTRSGTLVVGYGEFPEQSYF